MVDELVGLSPKAWASALPIVGRRVDGTVVEKRGLQACPKTCERLLGIRGTGKRCPAQRLEGVDFLGTLLAPLLIDRALGLRLAMFRVDEDPALRYPTITRGYDRIAIALGQRGHGLRLRLGQASWASVKVAGTRVIHLRRVSASFCRFSAL